ncbi:NADAR family protein [Candidatus Pacearchaeota archaeon]|nr:NADAR family protein [Candidatus Pacearchaeota archaeon]
MEVISGFKDEYRFLSNFWPAPIFYAGALFKTTEHAYQACKMERTADFIVVAIQETPGKAKREGRDRPMKSDWDDRKVGVMLDISRLKFKTAGLRAMLLETGDAHLEEANQWGDRFWGTVDGEGENHLGKILMKVRDEIREAS